MDQQKIKAAGRKHLIRYLLVNGEVPGNDGEYVFSYGIKGRTVYHVHASLDFNNPGQLTSEEITTLKKLAFDMNAIPMIAVVDMDRGKKLIKQLEFKKV
jgi:hypothetical protein